MAFGKAFTVIGIVLLLHAAFIATDMYFLLPPLDIPMHLGGGFAMGMLGLALFGFGPAGSHAKLAPMWFHYLFVAGFTISVAVAWEFHEYLLDQTFVVWFDWVKTQPSLADTMADLALGWLGGTAAFALYQKNP